MKDLTIIETESELVLLLIDDKSVTVFCENTNNKNILKIIDIAKKYTSKSLEIISILSKDLLLSYSIDISRAYYNLIINKLRIHKDYYRSKSCTDILSVLDNSYEDCSTLDFLILAKYADESEYNKNKDFINFIKYNF